MPLTGPARPPRTSASSKTLGRSWNATNVRVARCGARREAWASDARPPTSIDWPAAAPSGRRSYSDLAAAYDAKQKTAVPGSPDYDKVLREAERSRKPESDSS